MYWPRGKMMGGCSSINYMVYMRGHPEDYNGWARLGCDGWTWKECLPFFIKSEDNVQFGDKDGHGKGGPIGVSHWPGYNKHMVNAFLDSAETLGLRRLEDCNAGQQMGAVMHQSSIRNGERCSTSAGFLWPYLENGGQNLDVVTSALVEKVLIEEMTAVGVRIKRKSGAIQTIKASKEVIICAGTVQSPQLLMNSGIGPADHLKKWGIKPIVDAPEVGQNMQDHIMTFSDITTNCWTLGPDDGTIGNLLQFILFGSGPLATNALECSAFIDSTREDLGQPENGPNAPDCQFHLFNSKGSKDHAYEKQNIHPRHMPVDMDKFYEEPGCLMCAIMLHPKSKGTVTLQSTDPFAAPCIDPKYLEDPEDLETMKRLWKISFKFLQQPAFRKYTTELLMDLETYPEAKQPKKWKDGKAPNDRDAAGGFQYAEVTDEWLEWMIRQNAWTVYHPVGTCKMGKREDGAVVDEFLKVYGVKSLRVADCSIMPTLPSGNTNAPAIMVGERCADFILRGK